MADAAPFRQFLGDRGERLALPEQQRAQPVQSGVLVAEREPRRPPGLLGNGHGPIRVAANAPAALLVEEAGKRVHDRVEVRGDVKTPHLEVVADVADRRHVLGAGRAGERMDAARAAEAPCQDGYPHGVLAVVPVKGRDGAKTRLAPLLQPEERTQLVLDAILDSAKGQKWTQVPKE